jgi:hypothetical protein
MWERRSVNRGLVRKPERKRPLGRSRHRWEDNIRMGLHELRGGYFCFASCHYMLPM